MTTEQEEKRCRIKYQTIVYDICNLLDEPGSARKGRGLTTDKVVGAVKKLCTELEAARADRTIAANAVVVVKLTSDDDIQWKARAEKLQEAITAALAELKRNQGTPRVGLRGVERILSNALEGGK